jgi:hypothetical protein
VLVTQGEIMRAAILLVAALVLFIVAIAFGSHDKTWSPNSNTVPTYGPGGAACGFAIAGGLCLVGFALARDRIRQE